MTTDIGRKEIEEFGIPNLPTILNRFQLDKRQLYNVADQGGLLDKVQYAKAELLLQAEQEVMNWKFSPWFECNAESAAGLYIVVNKVDEFIHIGESSDSCERHKKAV